MSIDEYGNPSIKDVLEAVEYVLSGAIRGERPDCGVFRAGVSEDDAEYEVAGIYRPDGESIAVEVSDSKGNRLEYIFGLIEVRPATVLTVNGRIPR